MIEVELKCELSADTLNTLLSQLQHLDCLGSKTNHDIYYDTPTFDLLRQAVFVRVRNNTKLQFKFNSNIDLTHIQCTEREFSLHPAAEACTQMNQLFAGFLPHWEPAADFPSALKSNELIILAPIHNIRKIYKKQDFTISIDHIEGLGNFLEIEAQCEDNQDTSHVLAKLQQWIDQKELQPMRVGYVELWLRKYNPQAYRLGHYQLDN